MGRKKFIAGILTFAMLIALAAGCGTKSDAPGGTGSQGTSSSNSTKKAGPTETVKLRLWAGVQPEYGYDTLVSNFNKEFKDKGIQAEFVRYVNDKDGNLQLDTYLMSGGEVDVFIGYGGANTVLDRQKAGLLMDLTDKLAAKNFVPEKEIGEANAKGYAINNRYYGLPTKYENGAYFVINTDMFKEAGLKLPQKGWTYADFKDASKKLTRGQGINKVYGMFWWADKNPSYYKMFIKTTMGKYSMYKDDTCAETSFDNPVWKSGLQTIVDTMLVDGSAYSIADEVSNNLTLANTFLAGKCAMAMGISQIRLIKDLQTYPHKFETAIVPMPIPNEKYVAQADHNNELGAGDVISISSKTKYPEQSLDMLIWYIKGGMTPLATGGRIPLWKGVDSKSVVDALMLDATGVFNKDSLMNYLSVDRTKGEASLISNASSKIETVITEECSAALYGKKDVSKAVSDMKTRAEKLIADEKNKK